MQTKTLSRIFNGIRRNLGTHALAEPEFGYFVGISPSNPYATVAFGPESLSLTVWGKEPVVVTYDEVLSVKTPQSTTRDLPTVMAWAEGYFMFSTVELVCRERSLTVPCFVSIGGQNFAFEWGGICHAIVSTQRE